MKLVLSVNNGFEKYAAVVLHSFFHYNKEEGTEVFILYEEYSDSIGKLKWFEHRHSCSIRFCQVNTRLLDRSVVNGHVTIATYFRLLLAETLPEESKVLYLDCDLVVKGSLAELWSTPLTTYAVAAVEDKKFDLHEKLGFPAKPYFNAGVLLINLDFWREQKLTQQFLFFLENHGDRISFWDQDVLNVVLLNKCLFLNEKWNYVPTADRVPIDVQIVHFAGIHKPWHIHYPFRKIKKHYLRFCLNSPLPTTSYFKYF
ncbi:MAG TPA: glycosyltransferase family 8 protein, partial [Chitinophagaceae bacterium]|nr:glycosyltransferase family 8 protein [Chitinophagaceae bacterium]